MSESMQASGKDPTIPYMKMEKEVPDWQWILVR
jgi:hypothetical protein